MFSVIIPLYNKSLYIEKCLKSVFRQTFQDFEIIVVNDGSTDGSAKLVQRIIENHSVVEVSIKEDDVIEPSNRDVKRSIFEITSGILTYNAGFGTNKMKIQLINQINSGVSIARNNGAKNSKYDCIAFLDADDWWDEHFLEEMKSFIEKCPEAALFGSNYYYVKNGRKRIEDKGLSTGFEFGYIDYISLYSSRFVVPFNCSFVIVRKEVFLSTGGFNPNLKFGEDIDLWLKIAMNYKVGYINKPLAFSNQDVEIVQRAVGRKTVYSPNENVIFNLNHLENQESEQPELKTLLDGLRVRALIEYYLQGKYKNLVQKELDKVDFSKQSLYFRFIYLCPKPIIKLYFGMKITGSRVIRFFQSKVWNQYEHVVMLKSLSRIF